MADSLGLSILVGSLLGFLAGLGVGGGSLLLLWLTTVLAIPAEDARIINLLFFLPSATISCLLRSKNGGIQLRTSLPAILSGCIAAILFTLIGRNLEGKFLELGFGILLIVTGVRELFFQGKRT